MLERVDLALDALLERPVQLLDLVLVALDAQERAHARQQLAVVERLGDEVVGAGLDRLGLLRPDAGGDHDHRQERGVLVRADAAAHGVAVHPRHDHIEEDEIRVVLLDQLQRLFPGHGRKHLVAARHEHCLEEPDVLRNVVDDEDLGSGGLHVL